MMKNLLLFSLALFIIFSSFETNAQSGPVGPSSIKTAIYFDVTGPIKNLPPLTEEQKQIMEENAAKRELNKGLGNRVYPFRDQVEPSGPDPVWQKEMGTTVNGKAPILNFAGQSSPYYPPDCNGDVGPNHYFQAVNTSYAIYDKSGNQVVGSTAYNTLFSGVTGSGYNDGDPIILYDEFAGRWLAAEFSISGSNDYMLIAVSQTNDPTGSWYRWSFDVDDMPDYMKFGVQRDGYYMSANTYNGLNNAYVFERDVMLAGGASPQMVGFPNPWRPSGFHCIQPLDCDGALPPMGTPGQFITMSDDAITGDPDGLWIFELDVNWSNPGSSTFNRVQTLGVSTFESEFNAWGVGDVDQPGTSQKLDAIPMILMYRAQYRNFGTSQAIVCSHTVDVSGSNQAGIRWYELQNTGSGWSVRQEGTYAPDANSRWMGSIAMNASHEIALGYSTSSSSVYPGIRYCGQSASENALATGILDIAEDIIITGSVSQTAANRWGDYSLLTVDPSDDETFWYTTEYIGSGGSRQTRIATFQIGTPVLTANFSGTPTSIIVGNSVTFTDQSVGGASTWNWSFPGGTPNSYVGQNPPSITYNSVGLYNVILTVTDGGSGNDTETKTNYITVSNCFYCSASGGGDEYISGVQFGTINNTGTPSSGYYDYTGLSTNVYTSQTYSITVTNGTTYSTDDLGVWIDWNQDCDFDDAGENVVCEYSNSGQGTYNITVPATALAGTTRMRVRIKYYGDDCGSSCGATTYGEVEDYTVNVSGTGSAPIANFSADNTIPVIGQTVSFTDQSANGPNSWSWAFSPTTITYVGGTNSSSQNPQVQFDAAGLYTVTLTADNSYGNDSEVKTNYINASPPLPSIPPYVDDFESFVSGNYLAVQSPYWTTWTELPGSTDDGYISTDYSYSGTKSVKVDGLTDLVLPLGDKTSGKYLISFYMYIPSGYYGYYNLLQLLNGTSSEWGIEVFFDGGGSGYGNAGGSNAFSFSFNYNTWIYLENIVDLDNDMAELWINNSQIHQWQWSTGALGDGTLNQLGGLDMYAWNVNGTPLYYFDDLSYFEIIQMDLDVFLEGPYNTASGTMSTSLNQGNYIPLSQPFNVYPWYYSEIVSVGSITDPTIVDWVLVELRDAISANQADGSTIVGRQAAFLKNNGQVVDVTGNSILEFKVPVYNNPYAAIYHLNHLGVLSATSPLVIDGIYTYNFSTGPGQAYGNESAHKDLGNGVWGMAGGDGDRNGGVGLSDKLTLWETQAGTKGYLESDFNLDTESNNLDKDDIWIPNLGRGSQVPD